MAHALLCCPAFSVLAESVVTGAPLPASVLPNSPVPASAALWSLVTVLKGETVLPDGGTWAVLLLPQSQCGFHGGACWEPPTQAAWPGVCVIGGC